MSKMRSASRTCLDDSRLPYTGFVILQRILGE